MAGRGHNVASGRVTNPREEIEGLDGIHEKFVGKQWSNGWRDYNFHAAHR